MMVETKSAFNGRVYMSTQLVVSVSVGAQRKFAPGYFPPCCLHVSDNLHKVLMLLSCQLGDLQRTHGLLSQNLMLYRDAVARHQKHGAGMWERYVNPNLDSHREPLFSLMAEYVRYPVTNSLKPSAFTSP